MASDSLTGAFTGFTRDTLYTPVPNPLFGPLLEEIQDQAELKVTLRALWLLHRKRGWPRMIAQQELLNDLTLTRTFSAAGQDSMEEILRGLRLAVSRRTLLSHQAVANDAAQQFYLLNTDSNRNALARLGTGVTIGSVEDGENLDENVGVEAPDSGKPNIFAMYEENVGMLSPILAEELKEAEDLYPWQWVCDAFGIAAAENKRSWRYIAGILRRWAAEGKDDGKPGRHPEKDNRKKYLEAYERRWGAPSP